MISLNPAGSWVMAQHWGGLHAIAALFHNWLVSRRARACQHAGRQAGWDRSICHGLAWGCLEGGTACWATYFISGTMWVSFCVRVCVCLHLQLDISSLDIPYMHCCCLGRLQASRVFGSLYLAFPLFLLCHYYIPSCQLVECKYPHLI